jgi:MSHA biogenesis protein MshG
MAKFAYKSRDGRGGLVEGVLDGDSASSVARILQGRALTPVSIAEVKAKHPAGPGTIGRTGRRKARGKPTLDDLMFFCRQMHTLARSGVPLIRGIAGLAETTRNEALAKALVEIIRDLEGGFGLSHAFNQHPRVFPPVVVGILQVGENSGRVDEAFLQLSDYLDRERETRMRMKAAVRYPIMVLVTIAVAIAVINVFVIPAFAKVFAGFNAQLPWATRVLLATSNFTVKNWPVLLVAGITAVGLWMRFLRTAKGRLWWDRHKLRLPVIGPILNKATLARFSRSFAMMMKSGVPITQGLTLLAGALDNEYMAGLIAELRRSIERGDTVSRTAATLGLFPPLVMQMIEVGEESGRLEEMMSEVASFYEREVDIDLKNLSSAIEPILLLVVGGMVMVLALGVFLPMWDLGKAAMQHG